MQVNTSEACGGADLYRRARLSRYMEIGGKLSRHLHKVGVRLANPGPALEIKTFKNNILRVGAILPSFRKDFMIPVKDARQGETRESQQRVLTLSLILAAAFLVGAASVAAIAF